MKLKNLDKLVPEDKIIMLGGREYRLPGGVPVKYMLRLMGTSQALQENPQDTEAMLAAVDTICDVLSIKQEIDRQAITDNLTIDQYSGIVEFLFEAGEPQAQQSSSAEVTTESDSI